MKIKNVRWDITNKCNLKCRHCQAFTYYEENSLSSDLTTEQAIYVIDQLAECSVEKVVLLGGEPLLRRDLVEILKYMSSKGIRASINTNGILLDNFLVEDILENVESIIVSVDGVLEEEHDQLRGVGTYNKTIENIGKLIEKKNGQTIGISYVINKYNAKSSSKICDFVNGLNVDFCNIDIVHRTGNANDYWGMIGLSDVEMVQSVMELIENWDFASKAILVPRMFSNKFRDMLTKSIGVRLNDKFVCEAPGITSIYILNNGVVVPSQFLAYSEESKGFNSWSILEKSIDEIVQNNDFKKFLKLYEKKLYKDFYVPCKDCEYSGKQCKPSPVSYWLGRDTPIVMCNYSDEIMENALLAKNKAQ